LVIIYFGGNDSIHPHPSGLGPHVPLEEYVENMRKIANYLKVINDFSPLLLQNFLFIYYL
jgi:lysophospholipase L1-like esterase